MTSSNQASGSTKQLREKQYTEEHYRAIQKHTPRLTNNTPPVCTSRRSYELIIRRQASDTGKTFFECEICGRVTTDYSNLNKHCTLHTGEKPFKCNECEKAFSDRSDYDVHCRTHGEKTNRTTSNLKSHSCTQKISYVCCMCEEKFPSLEKLDRHYQEELHFYPPI